MRFVVIGGIVNLGIIFSYFCLKRILRREEKDVRDEHIGYEGFSYPQYYKRSGKHSKHI